MWPNLAKFRHFGKILKVYSLFGKIFNLLWQICYTTRVIFIVTHGQILKHILTIWTHWKLSMVLQYWPTGSSSCIWSRRRRRKIFKIIFYFQAVWPDLAKFHHFGKYLKIFGNIFKVYLVLGQVFISLWHNLYSFGKIFITVNGQILKTQSGHLVTLFLIEFANLSISQETVKLFTLYHREL